MDIATRPRDIDFADFHGANKGQGSLFIDGLPTSLCAQPFVPGNDWARHAAQGNSLLFAVDGGVQFLTRSHRTAPTEQTGLVPRVIAISFLDKTSDLDQFTSGDAPEVIAMTVFCTWSC